jgi:hypothetical protein
VSKAALEQLVFIKGALKGVLPYFSYRNPKDSVYTVFRFVDKQFRQLVVSKKDPELIVDESSGESYATCSGRYLEFFDGKLVKDHKIKKGFIDGPALIIEDEKQLTLHYTNGKVDEIPATANQFRQLYIYKGYCVPIADFDKKWHYWNIFRVALFRGYAGVFIEDQDLYKVWVEIEQGQLKE